MATTTNYGWTTPDDTALVKDGASAIRTLGTSVDTTTKNLNPSTTLGDIEYRSSTANTNTRLGIGSTGQVLTVAAGVPSWATPASGGITLLSTTTLSGATTTISTINQTYNSLMVVVTGMTGNTADSLFRLMPNGSTTESTYAVNNQGVVSQVRTRITLASVVTTRTSAANAWTIIFNNYTSATTAKPFNFYGYFTDGSGTQSTHGGGAYVSASALSSLVFDYQGTNTFAGGTVLIYGVK